MTKNYIRIEHMTYLELLSKARRFEELLEHYSYQVDEIQRLKSQLTLLSKGIVDLHEQVK